MSGDVECPPTEYADRQSARRIELRRRNQIVGDLNATRVPVYSVASAAVEGRGGMSHMLLSSGALVAQGMALTVRQTVLRRAYWALAEPLEVWAVRQGGPHWMCCSEFAMV